MNMKVNANLPKTKQTKVTMNKTNKFRTWKDRGAKGCPKCRWKGCGSCFDEVVVVTNNAIKATKPSTATAAAVETKNGNTTMKAASLVKRNRSTTVQHIKMLTGTLHIYPNGQAKFVRTK